MKDARAIGERGERLDAEVYAGFLPGWWERHDWHIGAKDADIPAVRIFGNGDSLGRPLERATPPHGNSANLGENEEAIVQPRAILELWVGEAIVAVSAMEARIAWCLAILDPTEECLEGPFHPQDDILQDLAVDLAILRHCFFDARQF